MALLRYSASIASVIQPINGKSHDFSRIVTFPKIGYVCTQNRYGKFYAIAASVDRT